MNVDKTDKTFDVLRELPVELSVEQVGGMVATFTLASSAGSWFSNINLNSLLMTSAGTIIIAGSIYLLSPNDQGPRTARASIPATVHLAELATTLPLEEPALEMPPAKGPITEVTPVIKEEAVTTPKTEQAPVTFVAPVLPFQPTPKVRTITVVPAAPGMASLQNCVLFVEPEAAGSGDREFDLSGFTNVSVLGSMHVVLEQGPFSVKVVGGDDEQVDRLDLNVKDNTLLIGTKMKDARNQCETLGSLVVQVNMPDLQHLTLMGSGDVRMGVFSVLKDMNIDLRGSGDIHFDALKGSPSLTIDLDGSGDVVGERAEVAGTTKISVSGSGDVRIVGHTDMLKVEVVGSGDVDASEMMARDCEARVTGSGDININCKTKLRTNVTGSGAINNTGDADGGGTKGEGSHSN